MSIDVVTASRVASPAAGSVRPTLLRVLLERQGWERWTVFATEFAAAAKRKATVTGHGRLADVRITSSTFQRWVSGENTPQGEARVVLEAMLGVSVELLLRPAPTRDVVAPHPVRLSSYAAALALDAQWATSMLCPTAPAPGVDGVWRLGGQHVFDDTTAAVQLYEATARHGDEVALLRREDHQHLACFVPPVHRGLILASLHEEVTDARLLVLDSALARGQMALAPPRPALSVPLAYGLDDLTYTILRAMSCLEDALLADDHVLAEAEGGLGQHLSTRRSAVARVAIPELSRAGAAWLGARCCAQHITGHLENIAGPAFQWVPVRFGEDAAMRLLFRHQHGLLETLRARGAATGGLTGCAMWLPEAAVAAPRYERIWLFLLAAWWELQGLTVWVSTEPEYARMSGLVLVPGQRAIVADWGGEDLLWQVDATDGRADVRAYGDAVERARAHSAIDGSTTPERLRAFADLLGLDWPWLTRRCGELGVYGAAGMLRRRSRLISLGPLDATLRAVGELAAA